MTGSCFIHKALHRRKALCRSRLTDKQYTRCTRRAIGYRYAVATERLVSVSRLRHTAFLCGACDRFLRIFMKFCTMIPKGVLLNPLRFYKELQYCFWEN